MILKSFIPGVFLCNATSIKPIFRRKDKRYDREEYQRNKQSVLFMLQLAGTLETIQRAGVAGFLRRERLFK